MPHGFSTVLFAATLGVTLASILYLAFATYKVASSKDYRRRRNHPQAREADTSGR